MSDSANTNNSNDGAQTGRFSLHNLSAAFARLTGAATEESPPAEENESAGTLEFSSDPSAEALSPKMIVEGMLFVGKEDGQPLTSREMAAHIRDVSPHEIESLIEQLNASYAESNAPYRIESVGKGYRFGLDSKFEPVRQRFFGRVREAKLTPQAIEVLSVVAYRQPIDAETVTRLRGGRSHALIANLVRRGLLQLSRPEHAPRKPLYSTTERFNALFQISSPQDLPNSEDLDDC